MHRMKMVCDSDDASAWYGCRLYVSMRGPWSGWSYGAEWACYIFGALALIALLFFLLILAAESNNSSSKGGNSSFFWFSDTHHSTVPKMSWVREE